jgi:hypothetical protein
MGEMLNTILISGRLVAHSLFQLFSKIEGRDFMKGVQAPRMDKIYTCENNWNQQSGGHARINGCKTQLKRTRWLMI